MSPGTWPMCPVTVCCFRVLLCALLVALLLSPLQCAGFSAVSEVRVNYADCHAKRLGNKDCHSAAMSHGPKSACYDFYFLYSSLEKLVHSEGDCPVLALTLVPK